MSFALPESMREYIDNRVAAGNYGNTSEYIRDLVRRDQEEQAKKRLRDLIEEGLASGRPSSHQGGREGTAGDRSRRDRLKAAVLRPQSAARPAGRSPLHRNEGGTRVAVKVAKATNAALDQIELDPGIGSPTLGRLLAFQGFGPGGSQSSRCCGATSNAGTTLMWSGFWASARTSPRSWAMSSFRTDGTHAAAGTGPELNDRSPAACSPSWLAEIDPFPVIEARAEAVIAASNHVGTPAPSHPLPV